MAVEEASTASFQPKVYCNLFKNYYTFLTIVHYGYQNSTFFYGIYSSEIFGVEKY